MPLTATNFVNKGPVLHNDLLQFYNLFTGVMVDQPVTFKNTVTVGGNQGSTTVPVKLYGSAGQTSHLLDLYTDNTNANPGWGIAASGQMAWGPGGAAPVDTHLSRVATQNGHSTDTAGILISPYLEVAGGIGFNGALNFLSSGASIQQGSAGSLGLILNQDVRINGHLGVAVDPTPTATHALVEVNGTVRSIAQSIPTTGAGLELQFDGTNGFLSAITRPGNTLSQLHLQGSPVVVETTIALWQNTIYFNNEGGAHQVYYEPSTGYVRFTGINGVGSQGGYFLNNDPNVYFAWGGSFLRASHSFMTNGTNYFINGSTTYYLGWNAGGYWVFSHQLFVSGAVMFNNTGAAISYDGTYWRITGQTILLGSGGHFGLYSGYRLLFRYDAYAPPGGPSLNADGSNNLSAECGALYVRQLGLGSYTPVLASAFTVASARKTKSNISTLADPIGIVLDPTLRGIEFDREDGHHIGFIADDWECKVPEVVGYTSDGELMGMDYSAVGAITFQALKEYIRQTEARLAALEKTAA